jgi:hypothetical protein
MSYWGVGLQLRPDARGGDRGVMSESRGALGSWIGPRQSPTALIEVLRLLHFQKFASTCGITALNNNEEPSVMARLGFHFAFAHAPKQAPLFPGSFGDAVQEFLRLITRQTSVQPSNI